MLSVLIPVYDFDVREFARTLHAQCEEASIDFEIILLDDHSSSRYTIVNRELASLEKVKYQELPSNIGRAAIRNQLALLASYEYLLFADCDSEVPSKHYIRNYIKYLRPDHVLYGGRSYKPEPPSDRKLYLRWLYGIQREVTPALIRQKRRYRSFMTNNFIIPAEVFKKIRFNETLTGYGHEDTLFGLELKKRNIDIDHLDNPLCHIGLETAEEFLAKTEEGVKNLAYLMKLKLINEDVKLAETYNTLKKLHLTGLFLKIFDRVERKFIRNLRSNNPSLRNFDLYKLGLLARELRD